jgi:hypothetical protein
MASHPPTSTTRTSRSSALFCVCDLANNATPLALFVGPDEKHLTGYSAAVDALLTVPSFRVIYSLQLPSCLTACENPRMTWRANRRKLAFKMLAFSLSRNPSRPTACEQETSYPRPSSAERIVRASSSWVGLVGEYMPITTTLVMDLDLMIEACSFNCSVFIEAMGTLSTGSLSVPLSLRGRSSAVLQFQCEQVLEVAIMDEITLIAAINISDMSFHQLPQSRREIDKGRRAP